MKFIDLVILIAVIAILVIIFYFNFIKKDKDTCSKCPYKKDDCDCGKKIK